MDAWPLSTLGDVSQELLTILRYPAEVAEEGMRLIKARSNVSDEKYLARLQAKLQAYIRQAENYFRSATALPYRSSPLLYYYSFMNLGKACLVTQGPPFTETHGLDSGLDASTTELNAQVIKIQKIQKDGIFQALYRQEFGEDLAGVKIPVSILLTYVSEVSYQCEQTGLGPLHIHGAGRLRLLRNHSTSQNWVMLALPKSFEPEGLPDGYRERFFERFEPVDLLKERGRELFGLLMPTFLDFRFFETTDRYVVSAEDISTGSLIRQVYEALRGCVETPHVASEDDLLLCSPFVVGDVSKPMNEFCAIYLVMFFLGWLVRYRPDYLDAVLGSKAAWLLESFVYSAPPLFLRLASARITGRYHLFPR